MEITFTIDPSSGYGSPPKLTKAETLEEKELNKEEKKNEKNDEKNDEKKKDVNNLDAQRHNVFALMDKCGECGGSEIWKEYDASDDRYHIVCNNIPKNIIKLLEGEAKSKTPKRGGKRKKVEVLTSLSAIETKDVPPKKGRKAAVKDPSPITKESSQPTRGRKKGVNSETKAALNSQEELTPLKKAKILAESKFCGFSISF